MATEGPPAPSHSDGRKAAVGFVVLIGIVSLFADATYEGARSVSGPFLAVLGASGAVVRLLRVAGGSSTSCASTCADW